MLEKLRDFADRNFSSGLLFEVATIAMFVLAMFLVAKLVREKRAPVNTVAWLLVIVLLPWLGVPLYLLVGGRKLRRVAKRKSRLYPAMPGAARHVEDTRSPVVHAIVAAGATTPVSGNSIRFLTNGEDTYATLEQQIRAARHTIHISSFILGRDDTGRRIVNLLAERASEGVRVRLLLDAVGSLIASRWFSDPIRDAGGQVARFMPVLPLASRTSANLRNHRKIAVFDHCTAMVGGHNLAREYIGPAHYARRWQDFGAIIEGPAAALLNEVFIADWCFATRTPEDTLHAEIRAEAVAPARGESTLQVVASGPDVHGDPLYEGIIAMIQEAKRSIWIVTPYFIPDDVLLRSLIVKARAGKQVTLITPRRSDHRITDFARRHYLRELQQAGASVQYFQAGMLHSKAIIIDDSVGMFGSANFDLRSLFVNFEIGVLVHSPSDVLAMQDWANGLLVHCRPPKPERKKPRFVKSLAEDVSRLLAPLL